MQGEIKINFCFRNSTFKSELVSLRQSVLFSFSLVSVSFEKVAEPVEVYRKKKKKKWKKVLQISKLNRAFRHVFQLASIAKPPRVFLWKTRPSLVMEGGDVGGNIL